MPLLIVGVVYLIVIAVFSKVLKIIEEKYDYYK
jgi:polar amino acid transport system permease protein